MEDKVMALVGFFLVIIRKLNRK